MMSGFLTSMEMILCSGRDVSNNKTNNVNDLGKMNRWARDVELGRLNPSSHLRTPALANGSERSHCDGV
jgi:hypothetical protein